MAPLPLADVQALAAWVGQDISPDDLRAEAVLSAASALVRAYCGETWLTEAEQLDEVPPVVAAVTVQVAGRIWHNPSGVLSATSGPFTQRYAEDATGGLLLTEAEKSALSDYRVGGAQPGIGTLSLTGGSSSLDATYVPTGPPPSGYPFPWYSADDLWP